MIRKTSETRALAGNITSAYNDSQTSAYSTEYCNSAFGKVLWENPNKFSSFSSQNITLNSSDYDIIEIFYCNDTNSTSALMMNTRGKKGTNLRLSMAAYGTQSEAISRVINYVDDTTLSVQNATVNGSTSNGRMIPHYVIGYKTGIFN